MSDTVSSKPIGTDNPHFYVRGEDEFLPERAPPASEGGIVKWAKENLFATWTDRIITLVIVVLGALLLWNVASGMFLRSNLEGVTQGEGTMARVVGELEHRLDKAQEMSDNQEQVAAALVAEFQEELETLKRKVLLVRLDELETATRLGMTRRVVPDRLDERITIAQSKLPLSAVVRLEVLRRELQDPNTSELPDLSLIDLTEGEIAAIKAKTAPWTRVDESVKAEFQAAFTGVKRALNANVRTDAGRELVSLEEAQSAIDALLADVDAENLMERPSRPARQFNSVVDGVASALMTTVPVSRLQKIRKDSVNSETIAQLRLTLAQERVDPDLTGLRARTALKQAQEAMTDAELFLGREMPAGLPDPLPRSLVRALDDMDFWNVSKVIAAPENDAPTAFERAPKVLAAVQASDATGAYANATERLLESYTNKDLAGMERVIGDDIAPLKKWAQRRNGSNWAVIANNWQRMIWGTYPTDKLWRVGIVLIGFIIALLPLVVPACRKKLLVIFALVFPLFLLFFLSGLSVRFYGFDFITDKGMGSMLYSEFGRVLQAFGMLAIIGLAWASLRFTKFGVTARPALIVLQILAAFYFVIMIWGTVINPPAAEKKILTESNFVGLLTADHALGDAIDPTLVQERIDQLNNDAKNPDLDPDDAQAMRVRAQELRPELAAARSAQRDFNNVVEEGKGTFVVLPHVPSTNWGGLLITMVLGVIGMAASLPIGIVLAFGRQSTLPVVKWFSTGFIEIIRGVPLIALLLIVTFVLPKLLPAGADYPKLGLVLLAICMFGGVYQAEVIRGGLQSLPKGQYEAAQAMGLSFWQESRLITLPQALKAVIPAIVNTFIGLFKDTTLVIVVGIFDLLTIVQAQILAENAWNTTQIEALLVVALIFFVLMFSLSRYSIWLEGRLATGHR